MKILRSFLFLTFILSPALSFSAELKRISATSHITAVTVYTDRRPRPDNPQHQSQP